MSESADFVTADLDLIDDVAAKLADAGLSPEFISHTVDLPLNHVRQIVMTRRRRAAPSAIELDEKITNEVNRLAMACLRQAFLTVEFGPAAPRNDIVKAMVSTMARAVASGQSSEVEEMRGALTLLFSDMTNVPKQALIVTETDITHAGVAPASESTDDQDEGFGVQTFDD
jgi:hypothetical protein